MEWFSVDAMCQRWGSTRFNLNCLAKKTFYADYCVFHLLIFFFFYFHHSSWITYLIESSKIFQCYYHVPMRAINEVQPQLFVWKNKHILFLLYADLKVFILPNSLHLVGCMWLRWSWKRPSMFKDSFVLTGNTYNHKRSTVLKINKKVWSLAQ